MAAQTKALFGPMALVGVMLTLASCGGAAPVAPIRETSVFNQSANLIDEGGPVFLTGKVIPPSYYKGEIAGLQVRAERLDGGAFPQIGAALVNADGGFGLRGQRMSNLMFVSTEFIHEDNRHRIRALALPDPATPVTIDATSTMLAASVAMAAQRRLIVDLDLGEANRLAQAFRTKVGAAAGMVPMNQPNEDLSLAMSRLAKGDDALVAQLQAFDLKLNPPPYPEPALPPVVQPTTPNVVEPTGPGPK